MGTPAPPSRQQVAQSLGRALASWDALLAAANEASPGSTVEWKHYASLGGWRCLIRSGKRTLVHLRPDEGWFLAAFALSDEAIKAALAGGVPDALIREARSGRRAPEGWPIRVQVKGATELRVALALLRAKAG